MRIFENNDTVYDQIKSGANRFMKGLQRNREVIEKDIQQYQQEKPEQVSQVKGALKAAGAIGVGVLGLRALRNRRR